ncbi:MAG TPA: glutamate racemase [Thermodesulfovibrionales bacterium]|nr:glutamate racemase [Thermodesulfovibrionales bacterium]
MNNKPIGVFDSGIGGLTVLREIFRELPHESTIYLGDTARVPYGIRSGETVIRYSLEMADFLVGKGIKLLVVACNTASAFALSAIKKRFDLPVIGVIEPGARRAFETTNSKKIGIIGTEGTIRSNSYVTAISALYGSRGAVIKEHGVKHFDRYFEVGLDDLTIFTKACPLFVPLVEEGWESSEVAVLAAEHYLDGLKNEPIDTLVLGCTHYPLLKDVIGKVMGDGIALIDSATETVREIRKVLTEYGMKGDPASGPARVFYVTDSAERFRKVGGRFLGQEIEQIETINVGL